MNVRQEICSMSAAKAGVKSYPSINAINLSYKTGTITCLWHCVVNLNDC